MATVTGTTAALKQTLADLDEAGQQDTRMYRGIVAELARRNENAPDLLHQAEGKESANHQESESAPTVSDAGTNRMIAQFPAATGVSR